MNKMLMMLMVVMISSGVASAASVSFGSGANEFTLDFTDTLSRTSNPTAAQTTSGDLDGFGIVNYDYQMGTYEITNAQFSAFAYNGPAFAGDNIPSNAVSWFEGAQFVNYLNTSKGFHIAYDITIDISSGLDINGSTFKVWDSSVAANGGTNLYRHKDAIFFLPSEDEWVKAAYWNGSNIQTYANNGDVRPSGGTDSNYEGTGNPWNVGSGSEELNGTYDMMGNLYEWQESPYSDVSFGIYSDRAVRGGFFGNSSHALRSSSRAINEPYNEGSITGFRVATVPEPCTMITLAIGGVTAIRRRRKE